MASKVTTLRIDEDLLRRLKEVARSEQRSVSGQLTLLVRKELLERQGAAKPGRIRGWLSHLEVTHDLGEFRKVRGALSRGLRKRLR
jgi:hypothetical protein